MPLPLTVTCFSKIQIGFTFLVLAYLGSPGKGPLNARVRACVCVCCDASAETATNERRVCVCLQTEGCVWLYIHLLASRDAAHVPRRHPRQLLRRFQSARMNNSASFLCSAVQSTATVFTYMTIHVVVGLSLIFCHWTVCWRAWPAWAESCSQQEMIDSQPDSLSTLRHCAIDVCGLGGRSLVANKRWLTANQTACLHCSTVPFVSFVHVPLISVH